MTASVVRGQQPDADPGLAAVAADELVLSDSDRELLGSPAGSGLRGEMLKQRTEELSSLMRCPVCQGLSVADSPTPAARAMKARVEALLAAGYSEEQILTYFEASYGEFIRLTPRPRGLNLVAWLLPVLALLAAAAWLTLRVRRADPGGAVEVDGDRDLAGYLERVRREVDE